MAYKYFDVDGLTARTEDPDSPSAKIETLRGDGVWELRYGYWSRLRAEGYPMTEQEALEEQAQLQKDPQPARDDEGNPVPYPPVPPEGIPAPGVQPPSAKTSLTDEDT